MRSNLFIIAYKKSYANRIGRFLIMPFYMAYKGVEWLCYLCSDNPKKIKNYKRRYDGGKCYIIGNGPSLCADDLDMLKNEISFASNRIFQVFGKTKWRPSFYLSIDRHIIIDILDDIFRKVTCPKFISNGGLRLIKDKSVISLYAYPRVVFDKARYIQRRISSNPSKYIEYTLSVTCTAIELAIYMGFQEIYLLGIDHTFPTEIKRDGRKVTSQNVQSHFYTDKGEEYQWAYIEASTQCYIACKHYAEERGVKIYNATRGGGLDVFERRTLEDSLS